MKRPFSIILLALASLSAVSQVSFVGTDKNVIEIKPGAETGLQSIYVLNNTESVKATYSSKTGSANVKWYKFGETGGAFAEQINDVSYNGTESILDNIQGNRGYYIEDGPKRFYFWLVDYSAYQFKLNNAAFATQQDCGAATLMIDAQCKPILYYSITGVPKTLSGTSRYHIPLWSGMKMILLSCQRMLSLLLRIFQILRLFPHRYAIQCLRLKGTVF